MSLKNKSILSFNASISLQRENYYNSVVHCAYYSCVQKMKSILKEDLEMSEEDINKGSAASRGTHNFLINTIYREISMNPDKTISKIFNSKINALKSLRGTADYEDRIMDSSSGSNAIALAESVLSILNKI